jgi:hypothetical protein
VGAFGFTKLFGYTLGEIANRKELSGGSLLALLLLISIVLGTIPLRGNRLDRSEWRDYHGGRTLYEPDPPSPSPAFSISMPCWNFATAASFPFVPKGQHESAKTAAAQGGLESNEDMADTIFLIEGACSCSGGATR